MKSLLKQKISEALQRVGVEGAEGVIEFPADLSHGDFATNAALAAAKAANMNPKELAEKIVAALGTIDGIEKTEVAGPGFINFTLSRKYFSNMVAQVDDEFGKNNSLKGKKIAVEYTSPNLFKPLHIGNLMANIVGETVSRFVEWSGADVRRVNYPSDIGLTVAKGVWGVLNKGYDPKDIHQLGMAYRDGNAAYEEDEKAKADIEAINKKLYEGDPELNALRQQGIETSLARIRELCAILGTRFDMEFFESETGGAGKRIVQEHIADVFEESNGAIIFPGEQYGLHTRVFVNSLGLPTYEAKDLALAKMKYDAYPFDTSIVVTGAEQKEYFKVIFKAIGLVYPELEGKLVHIGNGFLTLTTGKMSSRKGNVLSGEAVLEGVRDEALSIMKDRELGDAKGAIANQIAVAAIKYAVLKQATGKNIVFDQKASLSFDGDSGPYLQYSYVRAMSVLEKAGDSGSPEITPEITPEFERLIPHFPEVVERAAREYEPHYVTTYLTELASAFNSWYAAERIIGSEYEAYYRALVRAFARTMKNGLWLLGIEAPEKM